MTSVHRVPSLAVAIALLFPSGAGAATSASTSTNWSGYAISKPGRTFKRISASWVQPQVSCTTRGSTFSAFWVGLGGYHSDSKALEQIGTSSDCVNGTARYSAWYELVPAASVDLPLRIRAGDRISASVAVVGRSVRVRLADRTTGAVAVRTLRASRVDTRSAEWITEAPALCDSRTCETQALADFGTARFTKASATTSGGHTGTISDLAWSANAISLSGDPAGPGSRFMANASSGEAVPTGLSPSGSAFSVEYADAQ